ncbi:hypothetical protein Q31b_12180 [Novipirellula aureliae]|uniref:Choloylglycine hydrolase/NAAA C-terminal domain-containing protein n=1 Tax=Novipirellula aureliae TaxID=2527966 RepID=A0A5C6EBE8_9BACT|nr:linear amide C-N hydrolase [Novipirellula aureliae]TWU46040.1 hypothetical protein Q31b_12180 [Novipirellula aureliae]
MKIARLTTQFVVMASALVTVSCCSQPAAQACTIMRFSNNGHLIVARNHDWMFGEGMIVVNQRRIRKTAISPVQPVSWTSKYGSVSFVQFGREIPFAGMNEVGLTVDLLQLNEAQFPKPTRGGKTVNVIQWVQYQLDTAKSVREVIASLDEVYPMPLLPSVERVHYFVTDQTGDVAVVEFVDGQPVVRYGTGTAQCALTNSTCTDCDRAYTTRDLRSSSERRYIQAVQAIEKADNNMSKEQQIDYAFKSLESVAQGDMTQWSLVYQPLERRIDFKTRVASQRRWIDLDDLSFEPNDKTLVLDVDANVGGNMKPHLVGYTSEANQKLIDFAFAQYLSPGLTRTAIKQLVLNYPGSLKVAEQTETP